MKKRRSRLIGTVCWLPAAAILAVSLQGCSTLLKDDQEGEPSKLVPAKVRDLPDMPPEYRNCFKPRPMKKGGSADQRVAFLLAENDSVMACGKGMVKWYATMRTEYAKRGDPKV